MLQIAWNGLVLVNYERPLSMSRLRFGLGLALNNDSLNLTDELFPRLAHEYGWQRYLTMAVLQRMKYVPDYLPTSCELLEWMHKKGTTPATVREFIALLETESGREYVWKNEGPFALFGSLVMSRKSNTICVPMFNQAGVRLPWPNSGCKFGLRPLNQDWPPHFQYPVTFVS